MVQRILCRVSCTLMVVGWFCSGVVLGQDRTATISGKVTDESGRAVSGAALILEGTSKGTTTDIAGEFQLQSINPGSYTLTTSTLTHQKQSRPVALEAGQNLNLTIRLAETARQINEVVVVGQNEATKLNESAKAVDVIETKRAALQTADLGEVLAQTKGVSVRRSGGLGSENRFSLNGLTDEQIRFFLDGIPLAFSGYSSGIANVPVNLVEQVEIYKGVVPIRFGADALGGAVNITTPKVRSGTHGSLAYQTGAFGTHRLAASARHQNERTGFFVGAGSFFDYAKNNYKVDVDVADEKGRLAQVTVPRFHDAYRATGVNADIGVRNRSWAKELSVRLVASTYDKELQNNNVMTIPYGGVTYGRDVLGISSRYEQNFGKRISLDVLAGYSYSTTRFVDTATCVYDWYGNCVTKRMNGGEIGKRSDQLLWDKNAYGRLNLEGRLTDRAVVRFSSAPTYVTRTGDERLQSNPGGRDPLTAQRNLLTFINGLEYEFTGSDERLQNMLFVKQYVQTLRSEETAAGGLFLQRNRTSVFYGIGNSLRLRLSERVRLKASYEWATRLPGSDEIFGDGQLVLANLGLQPERSHNANLELSLQQKPTATQHWNVTVNGFLRSANQLILLLGNDKLFSYQNVFNARSIGVEASAGWLSPGERWAVDANLTWQDFRNQSDGGVFSQYRDDRIPNRPYLLANAGAQYKLPTLFRLTDELDFFWNARYVYQFYRGWESAGIRAFKQIIPTQFVHNAGMTYKLPTAKLNWALTAELQNFTNARVFDFFGVQKPGRAFYVKLTTQF